jgi:alkylation response protein AidB-like acyl-CoA dehydrogenase
LVSGEAVGAYVITEPEAGSDPGSMTSTGVESAAGWILDGAKWLLSNAPVADVFIISVKTDPAGGTRGISSFIVPAESAGLDVGPRQRTLGARALALGSLHMRGCTVAPEALLGEPGAGFKLALDAVNIARLVWGALAAGLARAALGEAVAYVRERQQFGRPLAEFQAIQFQLADLATEIEAARLLAYRAAALIDADKRYIEAAAMAKRVAGDMAVRVTSEALELLGGRGYLVPNPLERYLRQARMAQLADGTANIQRLVIARSLLRD